MEEMLCAMALKSANGRLNHRTPSGLCVCCERALKSAGERNTYNQAGGGPWDTLCAVCICTAEAMSGCSIREPTAVACLLPEIRMFQLLPCGWLFGLAGGPRAWGGLLMLRAPLGNSTQSLLGICEAYTISNKSQ